MVRIELTEEASLAAMRARSKFGIAIAAMIRMIATTINNSINEKPFCLLRMHGAPFNFNFQSLVRAARPHLRYEEEHSPCQCRCRSLALRDNPKPLFFCILGRFRRFLCFPGL